MSAERAVARMNRKQATQLLTYLKANKQKTFSFAKSHGAYFCGQGITVDGKFQNCVIYMKGMNPEVDDNYYENSAFEYGGDDFGETLKTDLLTDFLKLEHKTFELVLTPEKLEVKYK